MAKLWDAVLFYRKYRVTLMRESFRISYRIKRSARIALRRKEKMLQKQPAAGGEFCRAKFYFIGGYDRKKIARNQPGQCKECIIYVRTLSKLHKKLEQLSEIVYNSSTEK